MAATRTACGGVALATAVAVVLLAASSASALFCSDVGSWGFYYNGTEVTVPVALFRVDPYPNITSLNTAFPGVNTNSFSANWFGSYIPAASNTYNFKYLSDDGIRFFFQNIRQPEAPGQWGTHAATAYSSQAYPLIAGKPYSFNPVYFQNAGLTHSLVFYLVTNGTGGGTVPISTVGSFTTCLNFGEGVTRPVQALPSFSTYCPTPVNGLVVKYYSDLTFTNLVGTGTVPNIDLTTSVPPGPLSPSLTSYSLVYTGLLAVNQSDNYLIRVFYQDSFNLYFDNNLVGSGTVPSGSNNATFASVLYYPIMSTQVYALRAELFKLNDGFPNLQFQVQLRRLTPTGGTQNIFYTIPTTNLIACPAPGIVSVERFNNYSAIAFTVPVSLRIQPTSNVCLQLVSLPSPGIQVVDYSPPGLICFTPANYNTPQTITLLPGAGTPQYSQVQFQVSTSSDPNYPAGLSYVVELTRNTAALTNGRGGGLCTVFGLSRIITFDGLVYTAANSGDYFLSKYQSGSVSIQGRFGPCGSASSFACLLGVAISWNSQVIVIVIQNTLPVIWTNFNTATSGGIVIQLQNGRDYTITFPDNLIVQIFPRLYSANAKTWAFQTVIAVPPAYTVTFQSFRGLCGTPTSTTADDFLDFSGTIDSQSTFISAMQVSDSESMFVSATGAVPTSYGGAVPAILTTQRAVNSPAYFPTSTGTDVTASITAYVALYSPPNSPQPSAAVSAPSGSGTTCTNLGNATMASLCSAAGFSQFSTLQTMCNQDAQQISVSQASAATYDALYNVCTYFASLGGTTLNPANNVNICPTLCFLQGACTGSNTCTCYSNYALTDCSRQTTLAPANQFISPTSGAWGTTVRAHGAFYYMSPAVSTLSCTFGTTVAAATSVTEFDLTCIAPTGLFDTQPVNVSRTGVTSTGSALTFTFPNMPNPLYFGDEYSSATCGSVTLYPPVDQYRDCVLWQPTFIDVGKLVTLGSTMYCCARRGTYESGVPSDFCQRSNCLAGDTDTTTNCMASNLQVGSPCFQYCINLSPASNPAAANASAMAVPIYNGASFTSAGASTLTAFGLRDIYMVLADDSLDVGWSVAVVSPSVTVGCRVHGVQSGGNCHFGCANAASLPMASCVAAPNSACYCLCQLRGTGVFPS